MIVSELPPVAIRLLNGLYPQGSLSETESQDFGLELPPCAPG